MSIQYHVYYSKDAGVSWYPTRAVSYTQRWRAGRDAERWIKTFPQHITKVVSVEVGK